MARGREFVLARFMLLDVVPNDVAGYAGSFVAPAVVDRCQHDRNRSAAHRLISAAMPVVAALITSSAREAASNQASACR